MFGRSKKTLNKRQKGAIYEEIASNYLIEQGIKIITKNYQIKQGEVDIIAEDKDYLIFVEVKYRKNADFGYPYEAVSKTKQRKICLVARQYCYMNQIAKQVRYDVISICGEEITWYQNAFEHIGYY